MFLRGLESEQLEQFMDWHLITPQSTPYKAMATQALGVSQNLPLITPLTNHNPLSFIKNLGKILNNYHL